MDGGGDDGWRDVGSDGGRWKWVLMAGASKVGVESG